MTGELHVPPVLEQGISRLHATTPYGDTPERQQEPNYRAEY